MSEPNEGFPFEEIPNAEPDSKGLINLPVVILPDEVLLPNTILPIPANLGTENERAIEYALRHDKTILFASYRRDITDKTALVDQVFPIMTEGAVIEIAETRSTTITMAQGRRRIRLSEINSGTPYKTASGTLVAESSHGDPELEELREDALSFFDEIAAHNPSITEEVIDYIFNLEEPSELCDILSSGLTLTVENKQALLAETDLVARFHRLLDFLEEEMREMEVREDVQNQVNDEIARAQREMFLREQMRVIQEELGEGDTYEQENNDLKDRIIAAKLPAEAYQQAMKEYSRLALMSPIAPETSVIRTYIDWILDLPWNQESKDNLNLKHAEKVLEEAHFGLDKVKERVLEHIAVRKLAGKDMRTPIICFVGPPGVGKTSLGKSIAQALGREFVRVSLGGVRDEAEIRGHRRTYIGAMPGRIIQTIKRAKTMNPVFMLDEIDKLSEDYRGDPAAALLEVLDPEQNSTFVDHYLEVPFDLSKVLFIATANELYPLPEALEDRMEIIEFRAYTEEEKIEIAKRFLIPKMIKAHGLGRRGIHFLDQAVLSIIRYYTLEAGVRNLEREIANVCRKITRLAATRKKFPKRITAKLVEKYLGPPYLIEPRLNREDIIGVATGLVWTSGGGDMQIIEASLLPGKGVLTMTGSLGDILQESAQLAHNYMRSRADDFDIPYDDFESYDVHVHLPEGAVPKDGPSAGITIAVAIISVFTERKVRADWAMTGEVTLRGYVLAVGGVKEKVLAARRRGINNIILPADNEKDLVDIPKNALKDMNIKFVRQMDEVINIVLLDPPLERERDLKNADEDDEEDDDE